MKSCVVSFSYSETFTSSYSCTHAVSLSSSPVEVNRRIHTIHRQLQRVTAEPQATPPPLVIGPLFSDIQREFQGKKAREMGSSGLNMTLLQVGYDRIHFHIWCPPKFSVRSYLICLHILSQGHMF